MTRVVAVDWSGRKTGEADAIWLALVENGELITLENGFTRSAVVDRVIELGAEDPERERVAAGLPDWTRERVAASEDALDAAVSALRMSGASWDLPAARDEQERIEGAVWRPGC